MPFELRRITSLNAAIASIMLIGTMAFAAPAYAQAKFKLLYTFGGGSDGLAPDTGLTADEAGNLYGSTSIGGTGGVGTIFRLAPDGTKTTLYSFKGGADGSYPSALTLDENGNLYGTTLVGGKNGGGTVFQLAPDGTKSVLYSFTFGEDGGNPSSYARLLRDSGGQLYGVTAGGGNTGAGTVFKVAPNGDETVLLSLRAKKNGLGPLGSLIMDSNGGLYGTAAYGTGDRIGHDDGTVFRIAADGEASTVHAFLGARKKDGANPYAGVVMDEDGDLYGTTRAGGSKACDCGTVFKLAPDGTETILHVFRGGNDGAQPFADLIRDADGNLYGTTSEGGAGTRCGCGTVFKLAPDGTETILHAFGGGRRDGGRPLAGLIMDNKGDLYGTTLGGGRGDRGTVFRIRQ